MQKYFYSRKLQCLYNKRERGERQGEREERDRVTERERGEIG